MCIVLNVLAIATKSSSLGCFVARARRLVYAESVSDSTHIQPSIACAETTFVAAPRLMLNEVMVVEELGLDLPRTAFPHPQTPYSLPPSNRLPLSLTLSSARQSEKQRPQLGVRVT